MSVGEHRRMRPKMRPRSDRGYLLTARVFLAPALGPAGVSACREEVTAARDVCEAVLGPGQVRIADT